MVKKELIQKAVAPILTAACVLSQFGIAWAGVTGSSTAIRERGIYIQGDWKYENESWKHYEGTGALSAGWIQKASGWYYLRPEDGTMMTGWFQDDKGIKYYLNTSNDGTEGQMRSGWYQDGSGTWYFFDTANEGTFGAMKTGWQWIDGYCYYFNAADGTDMGKMYTGQTTPDGYFVNGEGCWAESDGNVHYEAGRGLASVPASENTKKTASSGGGSSSSGRNSSSNGGSSSGNENNGSSPNGNEGNHNEESRNQEGKDVFVNEEKTKLVDLGWIQYAVIAFQEGSIDDYTIDADGTDITDVCTSVDDDGTVVKWQTTLWNPGTITVTRISDGKEQKVKVGKGSMAELPERGSLDSAPSAILTNGSISVFDYWLDNYDNDGNVRVRPEKTTFRLSGKSQEASPEVPADYYLPDTMIDKDGKGRIQLKLSLKTLAQEKWFDQLKAIKALDAENSILNKNLVFTTAIETEYGKTGVITIQLPQTNLFTRGRYQLNLSSGSSKATMNVPLHLVDNRLFVMNLNALNPSPKQGEDFAFHITGPDGESFGTEILSPIYRVDLTMPSGKVKSLTEINQWYEIGPMLHICGTDTDDNVITDESGIYTVTAYADGYQTMTKKVEVGSNSQTGAGEIKIHAMAGSYSIDAMSSATVVIPDGGSGGSGSSGGSKMNGFLIFDHDLLANALILHEIDHVSEDSEAVVQWWYDQKAQAVMDENAEVFYDFTHYLNAVKDVKLGAGKYLSFEKYKEIQTGGETLNRPYQIKRVLEDGKLGTVESLLSVVGKAAPALKGAEGKLGEDLVLTSDKDLEYISKITALYLDNSAIALRSDDYITAYKISEAKESLSILSKTQGTGGGTLQLTEGEHKLRIVAEGYKEQTVVLHVVKELETFKLSLADNPDRAEAEEATAYHVGQMVSINAAADESQEKLRGDFMKNLTGVTLTGPDDNTRKVLSKEQGGLFSQDNYEKGEYSLTLQKDLFQKAGRYTVLVTAEGYTAKTLTFEILEAAGKPAENEKSAPGVETTKYVKATIFNPAYYRVTFDATDEKEKAAKEYLNADKTVFVNGIPYKKVISFSGSKPNEFKVSKDESYGVVKYLDFTADGFTEEENEVVIEVNGYETLTFVVPLSASETGVEGKSASVSLKAEEKAAEMKEEPAETEEEKTEEPKEEPAETEEEKTEEPKEEPAETKEEKTEEPKEEPAETKEEKAEEPKEEPVKAGEEKTEELKKEPAETAEDKTEDTKKETVEIKEENAKQAAEGKTE